MNNLHQLRNDNQNPEKSALQKQNQSVDNIWEKLKRRAEQVGYGSLICEMQVHQGQIRQVDITTIKERMRAD
jgi:hypothetical protein